MQNTIITKEAVKNIINFFSIKKMPIMIEFKCGKKIISSSSKLMNVVKYKQKNAIEIDTLPTVDRNNLLTIDKQITININHQGKKIQFVSKVIQHKPKIRTIWLTMPHIIKSGERRKHKRFKPENTIICDVYYNNKQFKCIILDISHGGMLLLSQTYNQDILLKNNKIKIFFTLNKKAHGKLAKIINVCDNKINCQFI